MHDKPRDECGVIGVYNNRNRDMIHDVYAGLFALQHRGQLSCGIAVNHGGGVVDIYKDFGLVPEVFSSTVLASLSEKGAGLAGIGHVRYSPDEFSEQVNTQPFVMRYAYGTAAVATNGALTNSPQLRRELEARGAVFQTGSDAELIGYMAARHRLTCENMESALLKTMMELEGAYSVVIMSPSKLVAARDPKGFRPLCIGIADGNYIIASESCAVNSLGGELIREIAPGEIVVVDHRGISSDTTHCGQKSALCVFEHIYFARPDSVIAGRSVHDFRQAAGAQLAKEYPVDADVVIGVPDSGIDAAVGYSDYSRIPYRIGLVKNRYVGRTFIQNTQKTRVRSVNIKLNPIRAAVSGKRVVLVDDSIVRGTTSAHIVDLLKDSGASEVHLRISSPPFLNPCYFGTDISSREYLIACKLSTAKICEQLGADSLGYLSLSGLESICAKDRCSYCMGCFTGEYPIDIPNASLSDPYAKKLTVL